MANRYEVGDLVRTWRGLVKIEKVHLDGTYTVVLDKVIKYREVLTNTFHAEIVPRLVITGPERFDD